MLPPQYPALVIRGLRRERLARARSRTTSVGGFAQPPGVGQFAAAHLRAPCSSRAARFSTLNFWSTRSCGLAGGIELRRHARLALAEASVRAVGVNVGSIRERSGSILGSRTDTEKRPGSGAGSRPQRRETRCRNRAAVKVSRPPPAGSGESTSLPGRPPRAGGPPGGRSRSGGHRDRRWISAGAFRGVPM